MMQNSGNSRDTADSLPEVKIIQGIPTIVPLSKPQLGSNLETDSVSHTNFARPTSNLPRGFNGYPISGPNRYQCNDCGLVRTGTESDCEHIEYGGGRCLSFKSGYKGYNKELLIMQGKLLFIQGYVAFPEFMLNTKDGYVKIEGTEHCFVCAHEPGEGHPNANCDNTKHLLKIELMSLKLHGNIHKKPLFTARRPCLEKTCENIESDSTSACCMATDFSILGPKANMRHIPGTVDTHYCRQCTISIGDFEVNDTLLGEHIYHSNGNCPYIAHKFKNQKGFLDATIGEQRYRRGYIAFPSHVTTALNGYTGFCGSPRCVVCGAIQQTELHNNGHRVGCSYVKDNLRKGLKYTCLL